MSKRKSESFLGPRTERYEWAILFAGRSCSGFPSCCGPRQWRIKKQWAVWRKVTSLPVGCVNHWSFPGWKMGTVAISLHDTGKHKPQTWSKSCDEALSRIFSARHTGEDACGLCCVSTEHWVMSYLFFNKSMRHVSVKNRILKSRVSCIQSVADVLMENKCHPSLKHHPDWDNHNILGRISEISLEFEFLIYIYHWHHQQAVSKYFKCSVKLGSCNLSRGLLCSLNQPSLS